MGRHAARHFDNSQSHDQNHKTYQKQPDTKVAAKAAVMDFMFYMQAHDLPPHSKRHPGAAQGRIGQKGGEMGE